MNEISQYVEKRKVLSLFLSRAVWKNFVGFLFFLLPFFLAFEHANIHIFKRISKKIIPPALIIPNWFSHRISFYLSDILVGIIFLTALYAYRIPLKKALFEKRSLFLWALLFFFLVSIFFSPYSSYPTVYTKLLPILTSFFLFFIVKESGASWITLIHRSLMIVGAIEAILAIAQYFHQAPIGLNWLGELRSFELTGIIPSEDGTRWIVDKWLGIFTPHYQLNRAIGTFCDCNPLGGFLVLSILSTLALWQEGRQKILYYFLLPLLIFALFVTFSRSALFTLLITSTLFFIRTKPKKSILLFYLLSLTLSLFLLQDQIYQRGGVVSYNEFVKTSDTIRINQRKHALTMIREHPITGVGYKQFTTHPEFNDLTSDHGVVVVHDSLLLLAAETGLISTLIFLSFLLLSLKEAWQVREKPSEGVLFSMILVFCLIGCTDFYPIEFQFPKLLLFLFIGLTTSLVRRREENTKIRFSTLETKSV